MKYLMLIGFVWASIGGHVVADTITAASGTVPDIFTGSSIDPVFGGVANSAFFEEIPITGVPFFDPTTGTLEDVLITVSFDFDFNVNIEVSGVIDENDPNSGSADANADAGFYVFHPGGTSISSVATEDLFVSVFCNEPGGFGCIDGSGESVNAVSIVGSVPVALLSEFIGTGDVTSLSAGIFFPNEADADLNNADDLFIDGDASMTNISYQVQYVFTSVPEPSALLLLGIGTCLIGIPRSRN